MLKGIGVSDETIFKMLPTSIMPDYEKELAQKEDQGQGTIDLLTGEETGAENTDVMQSKELATLSGIQISAANEIIAAVAAGTLTREAGINQLMIFLNMSKENADKVMGAQ
jgi:hypothetical protein